ncbi:TlpA disulfide reductase family protein [Sphingomonas sp.]|uniref:TlpA family protein disulfide reductase n=1 Tax=Sphingomonas sp. TaxID=28214 RepID=UPI0025FCCCD5|nr:TlpA disulfide reductase family protein [Sphingomonas sp.]
MVLRSLTLLLPALVLIAGCDRQSPANEQASAVAANAADASAPTPDEVAPSADNGVDVIGKLDRGHNGAAAPTVMFDDPNGVKTTLASFSGKPFVLNLWATWCGPCKIEMPALDTIAAEGKLPVVTVSQDMNGAQAVTPYFAAAKLKALKPYLDPKLGFSFALGNPSLPTTILYDKDGKEVWRMTGGMDWTSPTARELLAEAS